MPYWGPNALNSVPALLEGRLSQIVTFTLRKQIRSMRICIPC